MDEQHEKKLARIALNGDLTSSCLLCDHGQYVKTVEKRPLDLRTERYGNVNYCVCGECRKKDCWQETAEAMLDAFRDYLKREGVKQ